VTALSMRERSTSATREPEGTASSPSHHCASTVPARAEQMHSTCARVRAARGRADRASVSWVPLDHGEVGMSDPTDKPSAKVLPFRRRANRTSLPRFAHCLTPFLDESCAGEAKRMPLTPEDDPDSPPPAA
jgi:hypothetical protein